MRALMFSLLLACGLVTTAAQAATFNCRDTSYPGFGLEVASQTLQFGRIGTILISPTAVSRWKRTTDVVAWLNEPAPAGFGFVQRGAMTNAWAALMCRARRDGNTTAVALQTRWSQAIGRQTDGFQVNRAYDYFLDRLNTASRDTARHLSAGERALIAETLGFLATQLGGGHVAIRDRLTQRLGL